MHILNLRRRSGTLLFVWPLLCPAILALLASEQATAQTEPSKRDPSSTEWAADLADILRPSVVEISYLGREGKREGVGTGVIIDAEAGLVATNLHVIGEARPIVVKLPDGRQPKVMQVWASDPRLDLAILKIEADELLALALGDSAKLRDGQSVIAMGNPHGLLNSIVTGVISGRREIDGKKLIQLAMPIEPGNSGGPLVTTAGDVVGIVSLKSNVTDNLGFAIEVSQLKELISHPNPIDFDRWLTIGALPEDRWKVIGGATWRQQGGRLFASGKGLGFGGRSLCLATEDVPELPYEIAVDLRLSNENGAAGLVFHSDGDDEHYGFYPSQTALRFSRFDGPTVFEWTVVEQQQSPHYLEGDWNRLKVRCEENGKFICSVNDRVVFEVVDSRLNGASVGLAKFRDTQAEFRNFEIAKEIAGIRPAPEVVQRITNELDALPLWREIDEPAFEGLLQDPRAAQTVIEAEARRLERRATDLRKTARHLHVQTCLKGLRHVVHDGASPDVIRGALWIAKLDNPDLNIEAYVARIAEFKSELLGKLPREASEDERLKLLQNYLFNENGFHGSRTDYYHRANSYLHRVLDDREGLPLTLTILFLDLARALDLDVVGVGIPGHFLVRFQPDEGEARWLDAFEKGAELSLDQVKQIAVVSAGRWDKRFLEPTDSRQMLIRLLRNLQGIAESEGRREEIGSYIDAQLVLDPQSVTFRGMRAVIRFETGRKAAAVSDLDWILDHPIPDLNVAPIMEMRRRFSESLELDRQVQANGETP